MDRFKHFISGVDDSIIEAISFIAACSILMYLLFAPMGAQAETRQVRSKVYGTLSSDRYAGCMLQVADFAFAAGLDCPEGNRVWVTLDCNNNWTTPITSNNNFKTGQIALLTGDKVTLTIDDTKKAGGFCLAKQVILTR